MTSKLHVEIFVLYCKTTNCVTLSMLHVIVWNTYLAGLLYINVMLYTDTCWTKQTKNVQSRMVNLILNDFPHLLINFAFTHS